MEQMTLYQLIDEIQVLGNLIEQMRQSMDRMKYLMDDAGTEGSPVSELIERPLHQAWDSLAEAMQEAEKIKESIELKAMEDGQKEQEKA